MLERRYRPSLTDQDMDQARFGSYHTGIYEQGELLSVDTSLRLRNVLATATRTYGNRTMPPSMACQYPFPIATTNGQETPQKRVPYH